MGIALRRHCAMKSKQSGTIGWRWRVSGRNHIQENVNMKRPVNGLIRRCR